MSNSINGLSGSSSYRISGMESGLDTEAIVKQMTIREQSKIDAAGQKKQHLTWKRDAYREIISKIMDFKNKFFNSSGSLLKSSSFNTIKAANSSPQYVSVTPGEKTVSSRIIISDIISMASQTRIASTPPTLTPASIIVDTGTVASLSGRQIKMNIDGTEKTLTFSNITYDSVESVRSELQSLVNSAFGENRITFSNNGSSINIVSGSSSVILDDSGNAGLEASDIIGFTKGQSNKINLDVAVSSLPFANPTTFPASFKINGVIFDVNDTDTLHTIMDKVNAGNAGVTMSHSSTNDSFTITSIKTGSDSDIVLEDVAGTFLNSIMGGSGIYTRGTNAEIKINTNAASADVTANTYTTVIRNSNTFELDGTSFTLLGKSEGAALENITINMNTDIESVVTKIQDFVAGYNDLLNSINTKLSEKFDRNFPPLTEAQKKEMTETEVNLWTNKAKTGLLNNDTLLTSIAGSMRNSLYADIKKVSDNTQSTGFMLYDIGITTSLYSDKGKLIIDEVKLRKALNERPSDVINLMTQKSSVNYSGYLTEEQKTIRFNESGLLFRLSDIIENSINQTGKKGSLIELAGSSSDKFETKNTYNERISGIDSTIARLTDRLTKAQNRYFAQFTSMEKSLAKLNKQGGWISQFLSMKEGD